jgi:hypothetical protein
MDSPDSTPSGLICYFCFIPGLHPGVLKFSHFVAVTVEYSGILNIVEIYCNSTPSGLIGVSLEKK